MVADRRKSAFIPVIAGIILCASITILLLSIFMPKSSENIVDAAISTPKPSDPVPTSGSMKLLFAGTTFWGRHTNKMARTSELGVKYPFSGLHTLNRGDYDAWIAGLECPITANGHTDYNENTLLIFNCDPDYLPEAAKWFTAFSLGNNHTSNWGAEGFATTKKYLTQAGIQYFGHYDYSDTEEICAPIILPMQLKYSDESEQILEIPIGLCGIHGVLGIPTEAALKEIQRYSNIIPTIVMPHMGAEYKPSADTLRTNIYRKIIDLGAEMVIGDHPHWIQNTEAYKGKLIVYSMGNFMFDQLWHTELQRSAAITASATFEANIDYEAWDSLSKSCLNNRINCFDEIIKANLPRINPSWSFGYQGTTSATSRIPRLADPAEQAAIGERLNWANTIRNLK